MALVIPIWFDGSGMSQQQVRKEIHERGWEAARYNVREFQVRDRIIVVRARPKR